MIPTNCFQENTHTQNLIYNKIVGLGLIRVNALVKGIHIGFLSLLKFMGNIGVKYNSVRF